MSAVAWPLAGPVAGVTPATRRPWVRSVAAGVVVAHTALPMSTRTRTADSSHLAQQQIRAGDEDLMLRYAAGELAAFASLYERHKGGVFRYLLRHGAGNASEELAQDVWASLIRVRAQYQVTAKFTTYLYRLAHNRLIDFYRAEGRAEWVSRDNDDATDDLVTAQPGPRTDQPDVRAESNRIAERLRIAIGSLPPAQREAFLLQQEGGMSVAEIAATTRVPEETAKSRLRYAITKLRSQLEDLL
ncbi:MAG: sigma-70 family RNA polymerase sigma factor [Betaproteobacteria bacterium]